MPILVATRQPSKARKITATDTQCTMMLDLDGLTDPSLTKRVSRRKSSSTMTLGGRQAVNLSRPGAMTSDPGSDVAPPVIPALPCGKPAVPIVDVKWSSEFNVFFDVTLGGDLSLVTSSV